MTILNLITHSGRFHADDVSAAAILAALYPDAEIIRTRDNELIERLAASAVIFDVGRIHDPEANRFDHHMRDAAKREDGITYSSFGLVWKKFGMAVLERSMPDADPETRRGVFDRFDSQIVLPIDMMDNGHASPDAFGAMAGISLPALIDAMNTEPVGRMSPEDFERAQMERFQQSVIATQTVYLNAILAIEAELENDRTIRTAIRDQWGAELLVLDIPNEAQRAIDAMGASHIRMIMQPGSSGGYGLTVARRHAGSYDNLMDFPEAWAGLSGEDLAAVTGVAGATFCHAARFYVAARTEADAIALAELALRPSADNAPSL